MNEPGFVARSTLTFLFAGYAVVWVILFGYIWFLGRRQRRLEAEVARLERATGEGR